MPRKNHADNLTYNKAYYEKNRTRCRAAVQKHRDSNKANGLCIMCTKPAVPGIQTCAKHWLCSKANATVGSGAVPVAIRLWKKFASQQYRCALTGKLLSPGKDASIDHVVPVAVRPDLASDLENLEWVETRVNLAKGMLSKDEFIQLCRDVVAYADTKQQEPGESPFSDVQPDDWIQYRTGPAKKPDTAGVVERHKRGWADTPLG